jgi:hypothetical protein
MKVEVLYLAGCPHHSAAVDIVREILRKESVSAELMELEIKDSASAERLRFLGSPSIRIDGEDIEVSARPSRAFGLSCRTYVANGKRSGAPPPDWVRAAVHEADGKRQ